MSLLRIYNTRLPDWYTLMGYFINSKLSFMLEEWSHVELKRTWGYTFALWHHCSTVTPSKLSLYDDATETAEQLRWKSVKTVIIMLKRSKTETTESVSASQVNWCQVLSLAFDLRMVLHLTTNVPHAKSSVSHRCVQWSAMATAARGVSFGPKQSWNPGC